MPEIRHGQAVQIAPGLRRITASNPGVMTGEGTNTYLLGERDVAVLDPGPNMPGHVKSIMTAIDERRGRLHRIIVTHTHIDHSPATSRLRKYASAEIIGALAPDCQFQDKSFVPDTRCEHDQVFETDEYSLRAIATPGHVANHFCFLDERNGVLMTGDHIMNGSTVVIIPPSGDMAAYIHSLQRLLAYPLKQLAPGHGDVMANPLEVVQGLVDHRLAREAKVVRVLEARGQGSVDAMVIDVYDDVAPELHPVAQLSLLAHLIKLEQDGRVRRNEGSWHFVQV